MKGHKLDPYRALLVSVFVWHLFLMSFFKNMLCTSVKTGNSLFKTMLHPRKNITATSNGLQEARRDKRRGEGGGGQAMDAFT